MNLPPIPSFEQCASGMFLLMLSRIEEHAADHDGKAPRFFVLHEEGCKAFVAESFRRYGCLERVKFKLNPFDIPLDCPSLMGVPIVLCQAKNDPGCYDKYIDASGEAQPL